MLKGEVKGAAVQMQHSRFGLPMSLLDEQAAQHSCCSGPARFGLILQTSCREQLDAQAGEH